MIFFFHRNGRSLLKGRVIRLLNTLKINYHKNVLGREALQLLLISMFRKRVVSLENVRPNKFESERRFMPESNIRFLRVGVRSRMMGPENVVGARCNLAKSMDGFDVLGENTVTVFVSGFFLGGC